MNRVAIVVLSIFMLVAAATSHATVPVTLKGSPASMQRQNRVAQQEGFVFIETRSELERLVNEGVLVTLEGNRDYAVKRTVSYKVAQPEMRLFIERLAQQYRAATGEQLVVTSLTRPQSRQPGNSHALSVHPTGMAVDLRVSSRRASRAWLEAVLLKLERQGLLDVTRERWPPHYHVALFPDAYRVHVEGMIGAEATAAALAGEQYEEEPEEQAAPTAQQVVTVASFEAPEERAEDEASRWWLLLAVPAVALFARGVQRLRLVPFIRRRRDMARG